MFNLKMSKKTKKEMDAPIEVSSENEDRYPYGTTLTFEKESIEKSDFLKTTDDNIPVKIIAKGFVNNVRIGDDRKRKR